MGNLRLNDEGRLLEALERQGTPTPCYCYDLKLLRATLDEIERHTADAPIQVHYALKANGNPMVVQEIVRRGLGVDVVSGGEIRAALEAGFAPQSVNYSGVGKTDDEIVLGLDAGIGCFNVESIPELEVINQLAGCRGVQAPVAIRVNPDIDAHTHRYITTGTASDKFGIVVDDLPGVLALVQSMAHVRLRGLHFHIGSQITSMRPFEMLCDAVNQLQDQYEEQGIRFEMLNMGGGLGIDYERPQEQPIAALADFFSTFKRLLHLRPWQTLHFELGRAIVAPCGTLVTRVLFVKENRGKRFVIVDAGMNDLLRPALYGARHQVRNLTATAGGHMLCDVVGPVCESTDVFARDCLLPVTCRGDLLALASAGAYGESMASTYNMRPLPRSVVVE